MVRQFIYAGICLAGFVASVSVQAADTAATVAAAPAYSSTATDIGTLLDNPTTKAVLVKYVPELVNNPQIGMARGMTLKQVQSYAGDTLTDEMLAKIDTDLAKVPAAK